MTMHGLIIITTKESVMDTRTVATATVMALRTSALRCVSCSSVGACMRWCVTVCESVMREQSDECTAARTHIQAHSQSCRDKGGGTPSCSGRQALVAAQPSACTHFLIYLCDTHPYSFITNSDLAPVGIPLTVQCVRERYFLTARTKTF